MQEYIPCMMKLLVNEYPLNGVVRCPLPSLWTTEKKVSLITVINQLLALRRKHAIQVTIDQNVTYLQSSKNDL